jgi:hypothetical protein
LDAVPTVMFVQVSTGGSLSMTVTVKLHVVFVPAAFVAVTLTVVSPTEKKNGEVIFVPPVL